ncbi:alpha-amylase family glycosyl hydrolase [Haliangium sp.]|uniref:alpha-amylase family glycosyl hydrolase n=1 Tax=Haliangium sp. TaxID=2663208 RepID=UPI003D15202F
MRSIGAIVSAGLAGLAAGLLLGACPGAPGEHAPAPVTPAATVSPSPSADAAPAPASAAGQVTTAAAATGQWQHDWAHGAVMYEVFVRSFRDSDGDGVGDLPGLIAALDYLNDGDPTTDTDLGVDGLWLMPVFTSPSYHGYDVIDYENIDPVYGSNNDFARLCAEAHARGMRVIIDFVLNHTSVQHPWFVASASEPEGPYRDWYSWSDYDPGWTRPWGDPDPTWHPNPHGPGYYHGIFWGGMPDLEFRTPAVRAEMKRLLGLWLRRGVDGYRLDATRHLVANGAGALQSDQPETHAYLRELSAHVRALAPHALLVGENWTHAEAIAAYYGSVDEVQGGDELPASFNFPLADALVSAINGEVAAPIVRALAEMERHYPPGVLDAPFLRNHDQYRLASELGADPARLRLAAALLLTLPGMPFLYYGEEVGLENGGPEARDELKRTPMPWNDEPGGGFTTGTPWHPFAPGRARANVAIQRSDPASLLSHYRRLIRLRRGSHGLRRGGIEVVPVASPRALVFVRRSARETVLVVHNLGPTAARVGPLPARLGQASLAGARPLTADTAPPTQSGEQWWVELGGHASAVFTLAR